jgi:hypothetical protein
MPNAPTIKIIPNVDIDIYPVELQKIARTTKQTELTLGDLHGNALKLIHFLTAENVLNISKQDFDYFVTIYKNSTHNLSIGNLRSFTQLLSKITFNPVGLIRFLGDELADRGNNDLFTLLIFKKMQEHHVPYEILFSNHGLTFLESYELKDPSALQFDLGYSQSSSWYNLQAVIEKLISLNVFTSMVEISYKPYLKILSYALGIKDSKPLLCIYSHAPIGMETLQALADVYAVPFSPLSITDLCATIDAINDLFKQDIRQGCLLKYSDFTVISKMQLPLGLISIPPNAPFLRITWNRATGDKFLNTKATTNTFDIEFIHGHEGPQQGSGNIHSYSKNMINLDASLLGKKEIHVGPYIVSILQWNG